MYLLVSPDENFGHITPNPIYRITTYTESEMQEIILSLYQEQLEKTFNKYINEKGMRPNFGTYDKAVKFAKNFVKMSFSYVEIQEPCGSEVKPAGNTP